VPDRPAVYLILNTPLVPVNSTVSILKRQTIIITFMLIVIAFIISMIVSKRLSQPIVAVTKEAEQLAHGKYDIVFEGGGYDEADRLAETLTYASHEINKVDIMQRDLIANTSHDLRTPLTMLKAYAEMIRDLSGDNPVKRNEHLQVIIEETDRLTALVNDILDLSKLENGKLQLQRSEFDMEQRLTGIVGRYRRLSGVSGYDFHLETDGEAPVCCDASKIEQVICNLINNAMNYTGEDKQIFITQQHVPEGIRIAVRDTGEGMDQETLSRIFDKYYRSENYKREVVGTGLGLSIVKAVLRLHDYAFGVDSTVGVGSTFWFVIHPEPAEKPES
jgi:signal transduction histidine kinase